MSENKNSVDRDHSVFPEVVVHRDVYLNGRLWAAAGEVLDADRVAFAYSREGRCALGVELPNPVPMEPPLGFVEHVPLHEQIRAMVRAQMSEQAREQGDESFEEADDFEVGDDFDPSTPYEDVFDPQQSWAQWSDDLLKQVAEAREKPQEEGGGGTQSPSGQPTADASTASAAPRKASKKPDRDATVDP